MSNRKIPTLLGVVMVLFLVAGIAFASNGLTTVKTFFSKADIGSTPVGPIGVANISDDSFSVYWSTENDAGGAVFFGKTSDLESGVAVDERDLEGKIGKYKSHFVNVSGLSEKTKYYFKVGETEGSSSIQEIVTGPKLASSSALEPLTGLVKNSDGTEPADAFSTWQSPGAGKIAALVKEGGRYTLPLQDARSADLEAAFLPKENTPEKIVIISEKGQSTINCTVGEKNLPDVTIGETVDCNKQENSAVDQNNDPGIASSSAGFGSLLKTPQPSTPSGKIQVNIKQDEQLSTGLPTFSGKAGPKQAVKIVVHSEDVYSGTVIADSTGSWSWTPPATLAPGPHTVEITIVNANGTTQTVTRSFTIVSGQPILPITAGTPSGTITVAPVITPTPIPSDELIQTGSEQLTFLSLTTGLIFIILSLGAIFAL